MPFLLEEIEKSIQKQKHKKYREPQKLAMLLLRRVNVMQLNFLSNNFSKKCP